MTFTVIFLCLFTGHLIGDFLLQTDRLVEDKCKLGVLLLHAGSVTLVSYLLCGLWRRWEILVVILVTHAVIDFIKTRIKAKGLWPFLMDQGAHLLVLIGLAAWISMTGNSLGQWTRLWGYSYPMALVFLAGLILTVRAGAIFIGFVVQDLQSQLERARQDATGTQEPGLLSLRLGFPHGGRLIGQLERALILLLVLVDQPAGIGFLIAAKSVFRFGELKDAANRMEAEYIIIGTLWSFLYGLLIAYLTRFALNNFPY